MHLFALLHLGVFGDREGVIRNIKYAHPGRTDISKPPALVAFNSSLFDSAGANGLCNVAKSGFEIKWHKKIPFRPQAFCGQSEQPKRQRPYLFILGCGFSATGATANMLSQFGIGQISHEYTNPPAVSRYGVSSWPSVVMTVLDEPNCRDTRTFLQIRHPLKVVRSLRATNWNFKYQLVKVSDWQPPQYRLAWNYLSKDVHALLWWSSFTLLAENQLGTDGFAFSMEKVFEDQDPRPFAEILRQLMGEHQTLCYNERVKMVSRHLKIGKRVNRHAKSSDPLPTWDSVIARVRKSTDAKYHAMQLEAIAIARMLCVRYGYALATGDSFGVQRPHFTSYVGDGGKIGC